MLLPTAEGGFDLLARRVWCDVADNNDRREIGPEYDTVVTLYVRQGKR